MARKVYIATCFTSEKMSHYRGNYAFSSKRERSRFIRKWVNHYKQDNLWEYLGKNKFFSNFKTDDHISMITSEYELNCAHKVDWATFGSVFELSTMPNMTAILV